MEKLDLKKFEKAKLFNNQLRSVLGGGATTYTEVGTNKTGTDVTSGKSHTEFSGGGSSEKDGRIM
jgi:hypothetical protein